MKNVEDIYPLSPMQHGILFHTLYDPEAGLYVYQASYQLQGELSLSAFKQAWQQVIDRHPILRTAFLWRGLNEPLQVVREQVKLPWEQQDWRGLSAVEQQERLEAFLPADRKRGFDPARAPLLRLTLIQVAEDAYQFIYSSHHLLLDGWSQALLREEVFAAYDALCRGEELRLGPSRPYRDYIAWLQRQDLSEAEAFWRQALRGFTAPTSLMVDHAATSLSSEQERHGEQRLHFSVAATAALQSFARQHQLTMNTLVQGAWALLLSRYSGEPDVVFGSVVSGRSPDLAGVETMIGPFINTLPMRMQVSADESRLSWLKKVQEQQVEMRQYEHSPLVKIQEWSEVPRGAPLFESLLAFENYPVGRGLHWRDGNLEVQSGDSVVSRTNYPLALLAVPGPEVVVEIIYDGRRFDTDTIARMLSHFQTLLEGLIAAPQQPLATVPLLTAAERHRLLMEWNDTATDYRPDQCIHELFEAQVERTPDAVAVVCEEEQLTYQELNRRANQVAHYLRKRGVGPEVPVGICLERELAMAVGLLGILKAGGAYLPLDPNYPKQRLAWMLEDAQVPVLLTLARLVAGLPEHQAQVVCLDTDWEAIAKERQQNPVSSVAADHLAYVISTSGSTGTPKGVMIQHRSLVNHIQAASAVFALGAGDRLLQFAALSFDTSAQEVFTCLTRGATLVLRTDLMLGSPAVFLRQCREWSITVLDLPTAYWHELTVGIEAEGCVMPESIRLVIIGGERARPERVMAWRQQMGPGVRLVNAYGPTETAIAATMSELSGSAEDEPAWREVPIGRALPNVQTYVLDAHLNPVPVGVVGELHIGGAGLARGYLNRPEQTAERFIPDPFSDEPDARLYRTGDLCRWRPEGTIEFLGRLDHQVKIRGFRLELGEVEAVLGQHPAVREVVVLARENDPGDKRLVAYVVPRPEQAPAVSELRSFLKEKLPEYMVPAAFVTLAELPLTPHGKVDRLALPLPDQTRPELEETFVAPRTPAEEVLAGIWAEVLRVERVGIDDNFFELGGHSLLATQAISRVCQAFQVEMPLRHLFEAPTIAELALLIEELLIEEIDELSDGEVQYLMEGR